MGMEVVDWESEKEKLIFQKNRNREQFSTVSQWLELLEDGENLLPYFKEHNCSHIVIYGAAEMGRLLLKELQKDKQLQVLAFLDQNAENQREKWGIPVYLPAEFSGLGDIDMVVVTAISFFESVRENLLKSRPEIPVVSLKTIITARKDEVWHEQR